MRERTHPLGNAEPATSWVTERLVVSVTKTGELGRRLGVPGWEQVCCRERSMVANGQQVVGDVKRESGEPQAGYVAMGAV